MGGCARLAVAVAMALAAAAAFSMPAAQAHTVDAVGDYRLEIGWMNEPVVSGETNGIELYISPLEPCPGTDIAMDCAASQEFAGGIVGLEDEIKVQLVYQGETIWLPLAADHNIAGKYYAFVDPTASGYYQANIVGEIDGTRLSLSMHPPRVDERLYIEFPVPADAELREIAAEHANITADLVLLRADLDGLAGDVQDAAEAAAAAAAAAEAAAASQPPQPDPIAAYAGVGLGLAGLAAGGAAFAAVFRGRGPR